MSILYISVSLLTNNPAADSLWKASLSNELLEYLKHLGNEQLSSNATETDCNTMNSSFPAKHHENLWVR